MEEQTLQQPVTLEYLDKKIDTMGASIRAEIHNLVDFLKENMVTKAELNMSLDEVRSEIRTVHTKLKADIEDIRTQLAALQTDVHQNYTKLDEIERELQEVKHHITRIEAKTQADDDVIIQNLLWPK